MSKRIAKVVVVPVEKYRALLAVAGEARRVASGQTNVDEEQLPGLARALARLDKVSAKGEP